MERWLTKSRVLMGLCAVLLVAALNRQDPMVYGMFLFLIVVCLLGFLLPWLSLHATTIRVEPDGELVALEGADCNLNITIDRKAFWPAFLVTIEAEWEWASRHIVLSQTVPVIRAGRTPDLGRDIRFPCRGRFELVELRLASGFPLGLTHARQTVSRPGIHIRVLPQAQPVHWPLPWDIADDPRGELATRRLGQSFELGMLRPYQHGEPVHRVSWRASARVGELVIQHFQQSGSVRLRVVVDVPREPNLGNPASSGEQAIRLAAGVCEAALAHGAQLFVYLDDQAPPVSGAYAIRLALAQALPCQGGLLAALARAVADTAPGEQLAVVVNDAWPSRELALAMPALMSHGGKVVACIARGRRANPGEQTRAETLKQALEMAGIVTMMEAP